MEKLQGEIYTATEIVYDVQKHAALQNIINPPEVSNEKEDGVEEGEVLPEPD